MKVIPHLNASKSITRNGFVVVYFSVPKNKVSAVSSKIVNL